MALIGMQGFENINPLTEIRKTGPWYTPAEMTTEGGYVGAGRVSGSCIRLSTVNDQPFSGPQRIFPIGYFCNFNVNAASVVLGYAARRVSPNSSETMLYIDSAAFAPFGLMVTGAGSNIQFRTNGGENLGGQVVTISLSAISSEGLIAVSPNVWHYREFTVDFINRVFQFWVNGILCVNYNFPVPVPILNRGRLGIGKLRTESFFENQSGIGQGNSFPELDDMYALDNFGPAPLNARLGPSRVITSFPTASVVSQFTATPPVVSNSANVSDSINNGDSTTVSSSTPLTQDLYFCSRALQGVPEKIHAVGTRVWAKKGDGSDTAMTPFIKAGGAEMDGPTVNLTDQYFGYESIFPLNPALAQAWTIPSAQDCLFGQKNPLGS